MPPVQNRGDLVATSVLWSPSWDQRALARLYAGLGERRLVFVEPTAGLGWRRVVQRLLSPLWSRRLSHTFDRDVVGELREAGFVIITLDRFALGAGGLRTYAFGEAIVAVEGD